MAQSLDGVILLRFGNDEANRRNSVSEVYKDADALKAFINEGLAETRLTGHADARRPTRCQLRPAR